MHDPKEAADNRLAIERAAERLARQREQLEEQALAEAQRREQAAADLRDAVAARLRRETQAQALAEARANSEQAALAAANEKIQMERSLEAAALARVAAERDAAKLAEQRMQRQIEARQAEAARREAELQLQAAAAAAQQASEAAGPVSAAEPAADILPSPPRPSWRVAVLIVLLLGAGVGGLAAWQRSSAPPVATLRLDTDAEGFARRAARADFQDSSRRLVNPSAIQ
jgi:hypothetical protein